jgi:DNA polymerase-3 subunit beta
MDVMGQISSDLVEMRLADSASPTLVLDPSDPGVQFVLMPLRV